MPVKLTTTIAGISLLSNSMDKALLYEFNQYMKFIGTSENYQNGNLKIMRYLARFLGSNTDFYQIQKKILDIGSYRISTISSNKLVLPHMG
jgi:integrase/recombinase XerD